MAKSAKAAAKGAALEAAKDSSKAEMLAAFLKEQAKERPGEVVLLNDESARVNIEVVPTGAISLDLAIGAGGFPKGRIIEVYGPESGGKTTLSLTVARNAQDKGGVVGFVDAEHALNRELCQNIGIDESRFVISQPDSGEKAIEVVEDMLESGVFDVIIVDSVAAMIPQSEIDAEVDQALMGTHARLMSRFMRRVAGKVNHSGCMLILINQVRKDLGAYGTPDTTTGGRAIKFYASLRIEVRTSNSKKIERNKQIVGTTVTATVKKNKLGAPFKVAEYDVIFGHGIEGSGSLLDVAEALGLVIRSGASYTEVATGERIAIGKDNAKKLLGDPEGKDLAERLQAAVYAHLQGNVLTENEEDPALAAAVEEEAAEVDAAEAV